MFYKNSCEIQFLMNYIKFYFNNYIEYFKLSNKQIQLYAIHKFGLITKLGKMSYSTSNWWHYTTEM